MSRGDLSRKFAEFYLEHQPGLLRQAQQMTRSEPDAWDLCQETFLRAYHAFEAFDPRSNGHAWLRTILARLFIDQCRQQGRRRHVDLAEVDPVAPPAEEPPQWRVFSTDDLAAALAELPADKRQLIEHHAFRRQSYAVLAARLRLAVTTVGSRLHRIRRRLRRTLLRREAAARGGGGDLGHAGGARHRRRARPSPAPELAQGMRSATTR